MHTVPNQQSDPTSDGVQALEYNREHGDQEGQQHKDQRSHTLDSDQDVEYLYLNFDTTLPHPMGISSPQPGQASPPPCPNLTKYASPFLWAESRKTVVTIISCCVTAMSAYAAGSVVYNLGISLYTLGFAIAPMVLAPFSEINGRRPIFVSSGLVFTVCLIGCGATESFAGMLVARFFLGVGGCKLPCLVPLLLYYTTFSTMVGGVISDIYHAEHRNVPMSCFSGAVLFGTGLGPLIPGFIDYHANWRWIHYSQAIASAVLMIVLFVFLNETRGSVLLSRKAKALNKYYDALESAGYVGVVFCSDNDIKGKQQPRRIRWKVKSDEERESITKMITISCVRPFHLLFTEPVVFFFSLWVSFSWAVLYLQFIAIPIVFSTNYHFNVEQTGAVFAAVSIGALLATPLSIYQEKFAMRVGKMSSTPEGRLYFTCVESIMLPIGLFWFGWTSFSSVPWIVPTIAVGCSTIGIFSIYLAAFNYLADTYHRYASSAIAAQSFCSSRLSKCYGCHIPAAASSLLGGIGVLLTIVPWVLVFYGPQIRARSKFARNHESTLGSSETWLGSLTRHAIEIKISKNVGFARQH
ncbi:major facilitator superfamily domain-containing protein [Aspergillus pseudonomiae]|uniref:Major facilitator superfamily domain-containing protein n=1 Tax=Aspergillus pseudonomiae TaxID=1506151 RepID=A0A5N7CYJ7_9EURO|nr:major facilitator superfamily domain-containing protein [Aspergillus pseudonomiae]KAE8399272.1 major facilitator superfamily domain-containing protein [Aspergillus pseudonomiae]